MTDDHDGLAADPCPAAHDGRIVPELAVAVQLDEVGKDGAEVVERVGTPGVPGYLNPLDGSQVLVNVLAQHRKFGVELFEFLGDIDVVLGADLLEVVDLPFQFEQWLLEFQRVRGGHGYSAFT